MVATEIKSLGAFVEEMCSLRRDARMHELWFRGHADARWELVPGMLRRNQLVVDWPNRDQSEEGSIGTLLMSAVEQQLNEAFRREAAPLLPPGVDCVDIYFLAQHHGLPTRLLDWTTNPLAALYFAVSEEHGVDGEIIAALSDDWRMTFGDDPAPHPGGVSTPPVAQRDPLVANTIRYLFGEGEEPVQKLIVPLKPDLRAGRMLQQGSCFTLHLPGCALASVTASNGKRLTIPLAAKPALLDELRAVGVTCATLYPDLDHVAKELRGRFGLDPRPGGAAIDRQRDKV